MDKTSMDKTSMDKTSMDKTSMDKISTDKTSIEYSNKEYFELKYLEEVNSLFLECKKTSDYYGLNIFNKDFMDLYDFIYESTQYLDEPDLSEDEEEDYLNYNIYAEKIK